MMQANAEDEGFTAPSMDFLLPFGEELAVLLKQPYITAAALKKVLRERNIYLLTNEKNDLIEPLVLSYLSPSEFDYLFSFARKRLESEKLRNYPYEIKDADVDLERVLPDLPSGVADDPYGNYKVVGSTAFVKETVAGRDAYVSRYRVRCLSVTSDYLHTHRFFDAEIRVLKDPGKKNLVIQSYHTSDETELTNRAFRKELVARLKAADFIADQESGVVRFRDFTNEERVRFFMEFTAFSPRSQIQFEEFIDFSVRVDPSAVIPDGISMTWMRERVSTLKVVGKGLHDVFLLTEIDCRPHIFLWRVEVKLTMQTADGDATACAVLEFSGFGKGMRRSSVFQVSVGSLKLKGCDPGGGMHRTLVRRLSIILSDHKDAAYAKVKGGGTGEALVVLP